MNVTDLIEAGWLEYQRAFSAGATPRDAFRAGIVAAGERGAWPSYAEHMGEWPPVKKAIWDEIVASQINSPRYISAWVLTDRLYEAVKTAGTGSEENQPRYTTKRLHDEIAKAKAYARQEALTQAADIAIHHAEILGPDEGPARLIAADILALNSTPPADISSTEGDRFTIKDSHFGPLIAPALPQGCDMIVVFANKYGHSPVWLGMPHQLYLRECRRLIAEHGGDHLTIVPYCNSHKIDVPEAAFATMEGSDNGN